MDKTVVIMGTDEHAMCVYGYLSGMGVPAVFFDTRNNWVVHGTVAQDYSLCLRQGERLIGRPLNANNIRSLYWRTHAGVSIDNNNPVAISNRTCALDSWLKALEMMRVPCYNSYSAWILHKTKPIQNWIMHSAAQPAGMVPRTIYGIKACGPDSITKGIQGQRPAQTGCDGWPDDVVPCTQRKIEGDTYRVYCFLHPGGVATITYRIESSELDYRVDTNLRAYLCSAIAFPQWLGDRISRCLGDALSIMNWRWCGADLIYECNSDILYLLDCNPSPMFLQFQEKDEVLNVLCRCLASPDGKWLEESSSSVAGASIYRWPDYDGRQDPQSVTEPEGSA